MVAIGAGLLLAWTLAAGCGPGASDEHGHEDEAEEHDEHAGHDEHEEGRVELSAEQLEAAGVTVATAGPGEVTRHMSMPAVVAENEDATTHVNPVAPGIVRTIGAHLGDEVAAGAVLSRIESVELGAAVAAELRAQALVEAAEETLAREGQLFEQRLETAERVLQGAIEVDRRIYEREKELQEKAVSTVRPLLEAEKALSAAELAKERGLTELRAERDARLLALEVELRERRIEERAARSRLLAMGLAAETLDGLTEASPLAAGTYEIRAPRGGIIAGRHITAGEYVDAQTKLYTIEDLSRVWVVASAFEEQLLSVRTGQTARVRLKAFPGRVFEGEVTLVGYEVDPQSRALGLRIELDNAPIEGWPEEYPVRPGMFGSADVVIERRAAPVVVPEAALVHGDEGEHVFVRVGPGVFEERPVRVGATAGEVVEVLDGLSGGEEVAVTGSFRLQSVLRSGQLGGGHSH
jgi:cobalt-zinc-cadmium efflux system membrane fusion protein